MVESSDNTYGEDYDSGNAEHLSELEAFQKLEELKEEIDDEDMGADDQDEP